MKKYKKIKELLIKNDRIATAFSIYFLIICVILIVQLVTCRTKEYETYAFGAQADNEYELRDNQFIDTEFVVTQENVSGIMLNGYRSRNIEFNNEKLLVQFTDVATGKIFQNTKIYFKDQIDSQNIYIPLNQKVKIGTRIKMRIRTEGCNNIGPYIGISKSNDSAEYSWINGELVDNYICASICYETIVSNWLKPCIYFVAEFFIGLFLFFLQKKMKLPLFKSNGKQFGNNKKIYMKKSKIKKLIVLLIAIWAVLFVFWDYVYMKTMEGPVREKDAEVVCTETAESSQEIKLKEGDELSQTFYSSENNLSGIAVHIKNFENTSASITVTLYDNLTGAEIFSKKITTDKLDKLTRHVTDESRDLVWKIRKKYYVLEFPDEIKNSEHIFYKLVLKINRISNGDLIIIGGQGDNQPYQINSKEISGNICMVSLYSNQLLFKSIFRIMVLVTTLLISLVVVLSFINKISVVKTFIISATVMTFVYSFLIPPYCVPDERAHIDAVYRISNEMLGISEIPGPGRIYKRKCDIDNEKENTMDVTTERYRETYENLFKKSNDEELQVTYADNPVGNVTFLNYLPAAVGFTIARVLHFNSTTMIIFGRWINALVAICLMAWGIKKLPFGKSVFAVFGLFPIIIQQISSCSYDGMLLGAMFVYVSYAMSLLYVPEKTIVDFGVLFLTGGYAAAACKGGVYLPLLGLIVLVFWELCPSLKKKIIYLLGAFIPLGLVFIAQFSQRIIGLFMRTPGSAYRSGVEIYNLTYFKEYPNKFVRLFQNTIVQMGDLHLEEAIGSKLGRLNINIPWFILIPFILLIIACGLRCKGENSYIKKGHRAFIIVMCCASVGLVMLSMLLSYTQQISNCITGIQGRYYLPAVGLFFFSLRCDKLVCNDKNENRLIGYANILNIFVIGFVMLAVFT